MACPELTSLPGGRPDPTPREVHEPPRLPSYDKRKIYEVSTRGIDYALQGLTSDPFSSTPPQSTGLVVPPLTGVRFLFLLASRVVSRPTRIRGIGQYATLAAKFTTGSSEGGTLQTVVYERPIETPTWRFPDGNISWHLVYEQYIPPKILTTNSVNFAYRSSDQPALLYETFTATNADAASAAPIDYATDLSAYTPPTIWSGWKPLAGQLFNISDIRFPLQ